VSDSSVIIEAHSGDINVHTNKAVPNSSIAYLALALPYHYQRRTDVYDYYVPGCMTDTGRSFLSVVSVYGTVVLVKRFNSTIGGQPDPIYNFSLRVHIDA